MVVSIIFGDIWHDWGLPFWILLLRYSVLCTVESLSLLCLLFISWFIFFWRWCIDKLGVFHANQTSMYLDPHLNWGWGWCHETCLSPPVKYFYWPFQGATSFVDHLCLVFLMLSCLFIATLWSPAGKGLMSWPCWWCLLYFCYFPMWCPGSGVVLDLVVSWSLQSFLLLL